MHQSKCFFLSVISTCLLLLIISTPASALDDERWHKAQDAIAKGIAFLQSTQAQDGSWTPQPGPAITALVVNAMIDQPEIDASNPYVAKGLAYILSKCKEDGGIHDGFLQNYNTAISLSALSRVNTLPKAAIAIGKAQTFLTELQWKDQLDPDGKPVTPGHPFYGGAGYGKHGRPDMSNTQFMVQGLYDSGLNCNDPAFIRAVAFISRCQGIASNELLGSKIVPDGGFIYATSLNKNNIDTPESKAGSTQVDDKDLGTPVSQLRTYGSMTYAGFKSLLYANLKRDDLRVVAALNWIRDNYTLDQNPGLPEDQKLQGLYYYYLAMSRALQAWGSDTLVTTDGKTHDWANDLIDKLVSLQNDDGSWHNEADRWMEGDKNLVTAYALICLTTATR